MTPTIRLTSEVIRTIARSLILAWMDQRIEAYDGTPGEHKLYFYPDEFGRLFNVLGWQYDKKRIEITINLVDD